MRMKAILCSAAALAFFATACADDVQRYDDLLGGRDFVIAGTELAIVSRVDGSIRTLSVENRTPSLDMFEVSGDVVSSRTISTGEFIVLTAKLSQLIVHDPETNERDVYALASSYDTVTVSDDGRFLLAHFTEFSSGSADDSIFFNPNQLQIIDRETVEPSEATDDVPYAGRLVSLNGPAPREIRFAPEFVLTDTENPEIYAVVFGESTVSFVDLVTDVEEDQQRLVRLSDPASGVAIYPRDIVFTTDDPADPNDMTAYVLAAGTSDLFAIDLLPADPATGRELQPAINQVSANSSPSQLHRFRSDGREYLLVTSFSTEASVVDMETAAVTRVAMPDSAPPLPLAFTYVSEENGAVRPRAIFYRNELANVYYVELDAFAQGVSAMRARQLGGFVSYIERPVSALPNQAVAYYANGSGLSVLNLDTQGENAIPAGLTLGSSIIFGNYYVATVPNSNRIGVIDLTANRPFEIELPRPAVDVWALGTTLVVRHADDTGWFSFIDASTPASMQEGVYRSVRGLFLDGILDQNLP